MALCRHKTPPDPRRYQIPNHRSRDRNANQRPQITADDGIAKIADHIDEENGNRESMAPLRPIPQAGCRQRTCRRRHKT